ncbi:hypothetical protein Dimus_037364 [Dionaea muscipula]
MPERNVFTWNTIIAAHIKNNDFTRAQALFNSCIDKDLVSYNSMLSGLVSKDGYEADAFKLFGEMRASVAAAGIDEFTVTTMLNLVHILRLDFRIQCVSRNGMLLLALPYIGIHRGGTGVVETSIFLCNSLSTGTCRNATEKSMPHSSSCGTYY